jgi:hypothetical protein
MTNAFILGIFFIYLTNNMEHIYLRFGEIMKLVEKKGVLRF